ncbi:MAG: EamA family transporter, partial [Leptospiraceae bacterium]|nr:EamA family transporter [Leptospiraceae bacterium]
AKLIAPMTNAIVILFWRNVVTFLALVPVLFFIKPKGSWSRKALMYGIMGAIIMTSYNYLFFRGLQDGLAGAGGILVTSLNPIFNFVLVIILFKRSVNPAQKFALGLGLLGGFILLKVWTLSLEDILRSGNLLFLIASLTWAFLSIITERSSGYMQPLLYSFYLYLFASIFTFFWVLPYDWT